MSSDPSAELKQEDVELPKNCKENRSYTFYA